MQSICWCGILKWKLLMQIWMYYRRIHPIQDKWQHGGLDARIKEPTRISKTHILDKRPIARTNSGLSLTIIMSARPNPRATGPVACPCHGFSFTELRFVLSSSKWVAGDFLDNRCPQYKMKFNKWRGLENAVLSWGKTNEAVMEETLFVPTSS